MDPSRVILSVQGIEPGKADAVEAFYREYHENQDEHYEELREGGIAVESAFVRRTDHGDYLYYYFEADDPAAMLREWREEDKWMDRAFIEEAIVGGIDAYHAETATPVLHVEIGRAHV